MKTYTTPTVTYMMINTEDILTMSPAENGDMKQFNFTDFINGSGT